MTTSASHAASEPRYFAAAPSKATTTATETRHDDVVRASTQSTVHDAAQSIGGVPPRPADTSAREGSGGAAKAGHGECVVLVLLLAIRVVVRARSGGLSTAGGKDGRCVAGTFARPEAGRVVV